MKRLAVPEIEKLQRTASDGDADAQFQLAKCYHIGIGVTVDYELALKWYRRSAEQGDPRAKTNLGVMYRQGHGVPADPHTACRLWEEAAGAGCAEAAYALGMAHLKGFGVRQSDDLAIKFILQAADSKFLPAKRELAKLYYKNKDPKALLLFEEAAEAGDFEAQWNLGMCYLRGDLGKRDFLKARRLLLEATFTLERMISRNAEPEASLDVATPGKTDEVPEEIKFAGEIASISASVEEHATALIQDAAEGSFLAFETLFSSAIIYASALSELSANHTFKTKSFASRKLCWPFILSRGRGTSDIAANMMKRIDLGAELPFDLSTVSKAGPPARPWCFALACLVDSERRIANQLSEGDLTTTLRERIRRLPELSRAFATDWFEVCWDVLLERTGGHPEQIPELAAFGIDGDVLAAKPHARPALVRDNIKKRMFQTFPVVLKKMDEPD